MFDCTWINCTVCDSLYWCTVGHHNHPVYCHIITVCSYVCMVVTGCFLKRHTGVNFVNFNQTMSILNIPGLTVICVVVVAVVCTLATCM